MNWPVVCGTILVSSTVALGTVWPSAAPAAATASTITLAPDFPTTCDPFGELTTSRPIRTCGVDGAPDTNDADLNARKAAQNRVKNNFCAAQGTPALATIKTFDELQKKTPSKTDLPWGSRDKLPTGTDRGQLQSLYTTSEEDTVGEGSYVQMVAFILEGHYGATGWADPFDTSSCCSMTSRRSCLRDRGVRAGAPAGAGARRACARPPAGQGARSAIASDYHAELQLNAALVAGSCRLANWASRNQLFVAQAGPHWLPRFLRHDPKGPVTNLGAAQNVEFRDSSGNYFEEYRPRKEWRNANGRKSQHLEIEKTTEMLGKEPDRSSRAAA
jgi:hypothetical protein